MFNQIVKAVKTNYKKPDELRPAKAKAIAGRKPAPMTDEEKQRQRERLLAVSDEEKKRGDGGQVPVPVLKINMLREIA